MLPGQPWLERTSCAGLGAEGTHRLMKKWSDEEYRAWKAARKARQRELRGHIERIKAELAVKRKPA
jgi:hypothetical protein